MIGGWNGDGKSEAGAFIRWYWHVGYNGNGVFDGEGTSLALGWVVIVRRREGVKLTV